MIKRWSVKLIILKINQLEFLVPTCVLRYLFLVDERNLRVRHYWFGFFVLFFFFFFPFLLDLSCGGVISNCPVGWLNQVIHIWVETKLLLNLMILTCILDSSQPWLKWIQLGQYWPISTDILTHDSDHSFKRLKVYQSAPKAWALVKWGAP